MVATPRLSLARLRAAVLCLGLLAAAPSVLPAGEAIAETAPKEVTARVQFDTARPAGLRVSCRHPAPISYRKRRGVMTFTLRDGDVGGCYTDAKAEFAPKGVPHMERAEMYSGFMPVGPRYRFSAEIRMDPEFASSHNTTVLQVHQWVHETCQCGPPVMMSFDGKGRLRARVLRGPHTHDKIVLGDWCREDFETRWVEIAIDITSAYGRQKATIWVGGERVLSRQVLLQDGGALFLKTGLYRPGTSGTALPTDRVHIRNARIARLK